MSTTTERPTPARRAFDALQLAALIVGTNLAAFTVIAAGMLYVIILEIAVMWVGPLLLAGALLTPPYFWFRYRLDLRRQLWREWVER